MIVVYLTSTSMSIYLIIVSILEITQGKMKINFVYLKNKTIVRNVMKEGLVIP